MRFLFDLLKSPFLRILVEFSIHFICSCMFKYKFIEILISLLVPIFLSNPDWHSSFRIGLSSFPACNILLLLAQKYLDEESVQAIHK